MSIIQSIRDKAAWIIIGAIALALIAFVVQDAFRNNRLFSGSANFIGKINGQKVDAVEFEKRFTQAETQYRNAGYPMNDMLRQNIRESLWNEYVSNAIMGERYERLGIMVTDRELEDMLFGANPPQDLRQQFTDPKTGIYDANAAYQQIQALRKQKNSPMYQSFFNQYLPALAESRQKEKFVSLISNTAYVPKWLVEKLNVENSQLASISFVNTPFTTIPDSAVKVSDDDIKEFVKNHPEEYRQEKSRSIDYVLFDAAPTAADSNAVLQQIEALKNEFATTQDVQGFLTRNSSEVPFYDGFTLKSRIQVPNADVIVNLAEGQVYGPYLDGGNFTLARMIEKRSMPDSVKVRHILIKTGEQGQQVIPDSVARKRIDSIATAIQGGANFDSMVVKFSDDQGSKDKGGVYEFSSTQFGTISREFADVAFFGRVGDKKTVKVSNQQYSGFHYIEVLSQRNFEPAFKIAYLSRPILPSDETVSTANGLAAQFAAESRNRKQFEENATKRRLNKFSAADIKPLESMITGVGASREMVRWIFNAEVGDVANSPFQVADKFVVPVVTAAFEEGLMPVEVARPIVAPIIMNQKKADLIIKKIGNASTLEAVAQATGQQVSRADSVMWSSPFIANVGQELRVVGAAFNKANLQKLSEPIPGNGGVFVIKTENVSAIANPNFDASQQQMSLQQYHQRALSDPRLILDILKKGAKIIDNRHKFF
jgi:peptidyl-prolyl cis-trans isomerase D